MRRGPRWTTWDLGVKGQAKGAGEGSRVAPGGSWGQEGAGVELGLGYLLSTHCSPDFCLLQTPPWNSRPVYNCLPELSKGDSRPPRHSGQRQGHTRHLSPSLLPPNPQGKPCAESARFPPPPATALVWPPS